MLSVIIIACNEENQIARCIQSVAWAKQIVVVDSGSKDNTVAIAKSLDAQVIETDWPGFGIQKQRALNFATEEWVLNLDADEVVSDALRQEICTVIQQDKADAYRSPIYLNFYGKSLYYSWSPKHHVRLYKRLGARYTDAIVHESIMLPPQARLGQLKEGIQHHSIQDITHALHKMNVYSSCSAAMRKQQRGTPSLLKVVLSACWMFFRCYILQGGFLEGKDGFLLAVLSAEGSFYRGIKMIYHDKESLI